MKKNVIILGTTNFSILVSHCLEAEREVNILCYSVNSDFIKKDTFCNRPVYPFEKLDCIYDINTFSILNTIGYSKMNTLREEKSIECKRKNYNIYTYISKYARVYSKAIGIGNIVMPSAFIGNNVFLGDFNIFYSGSILTHDIVVGNYNFIAAGTTVGGNVIIKNNCFLGMNSTIKNKIIVEDSTLVGAGAFLKEDSIRFGVYVPQKTIKLNKKSIDLL